MLVSGGFLLLEETLNILPHFPLHSWILAVSTGAFYTLLADVDAPSSKARKIVELSTLVLITASLALFLKTSNLLFVYAALFLTTLLLILWTLKHRGIVHTPLAAFLLSAPVYFIHPLAGGFALLGYMTHLILDWELFG